MASSQHQSSISKFFQQTRGRQSRNAAGAASDAATLSAQKQPAEIIVLLDDDDDDDASDHKEKKNLHNDADATVMATPLESTPPQEPKEDLKNDGIATDAAEVIDTTTMSWTEQQPKNSTEERLPCNTPPPTTTSNDDGDSFNDDKLQEKTAAALEVEKEQQNVSSSSLAITTRTNPFAQFAASSSSATQSTLLSKRRPCIDTPASTSLQSSRLLGKRPLSSSSKTAAAALSKAKRPRHAKSVDSCKNNNWVRMADLSAQEQQRIVDKWHSLIVDTKDDDNSNDDRRDGSSSNYSSQEDRRFQVFVAARLHARCQEGPVRQAMQALYQRLLPEYGPHCLSASTMASIDPEEWMEAIHNLQYYPTKARHIHKAANEIINKYAGIVPESSADLQTLTGIGPVLSDLLAFVNTVQVHESRRQRESFSSNASISW